MRKAILVPYACYQNEPSKPYPKIVEIPENIVSRDMFLKDFFVKHVSNDEDDPYYYDTLVVNESSNYGDIKVVNEQEDCFLFVTYLVE